MTGKRRLTLIVALWAIASAAGQQHAGAQTKQPRPPARAAPPRTTPARPAELEALVVDARSASAEFAADVLLRLVESGKITERAWQRELLAEAFRTAGGAQQPLKRRIAPGLNYAYTREDYRARAFQLNFDTLSLRLRAVNAMLKVDKGKARALFDELPRAPTLAPLPCEDALVYDVSDFYDTLTKIATATFSADERARGEDVLYALGYVNELSAPAEVWPIAQVIMRLGDSAARLGPLVHAYSVALDRLAADDRSFAAEMGPTSSALTRLRADCLQHDLAPGELLAAFQSYLVKHLSAPLCADGSGAPRSGNLNQRTLAQLGEMLRTDDPTRDTHAPDNPTENAPARVAGTAQLTHYFTTPTAQSLFRTAQELRFGLADEPEPDEAGVDPKRGEKLRVWLNAMADWRASGETSEADYFDQKCVLYQLLLEAGPDEGPAGATLLAEYVSLLRQPARQQESRAGWLLHVQRLLGSTRFDAGDARARLLAALTSSGEPVLRLYANLQRTHPQTAPHLP